MWLSPEAGGGNRIEAFCSPAKPADFQAKSACIECLTKLEARPYFDRDFWRLGFVGFRSAFPASGHLDRNHTGQANAQRLHWQTGPELASIPAVNIQFMAAQTDETA